MWIYYVVFSKLCSQIQSLQLFTERGLGVYNQGQTVGDPEREGMSRCNDDYQPPWSGGCRLHLLKIYVVFCSVY